jgi:steroid delta-isomerase-like uncharacterized protein
MRTVPAEDTLRAYQAVFNRSDAHALAALYAPTTSYTNPFNGEAPLTTPEAVAAFESPMFAAFSNTSAELDEIISSGDRAAARVTVRAEHTGDLMTPGGTVPPTGKSIVLHTAEFIRTDGDGRIVEHHRVFDSASFLAQLGLG